MRQRICAKEKIFHGPGEYDYIRSASTKRPEVGVAMRVLGTREKAKGSWQNTKRNFVFDATGGNP
jgi:hypothetical protein